jgi:hypothetical protein
MTSRMYDWIDRVGGVGNRPHLFCLQRNGDFVLSHWHLALYHFPSESSWVEWGARGTFIRDFARVWIVLDLVWPSGGVSFSWSAAAAAVTLDEWSSCSPCWEFGFVCVVLFSSFQIWELYTVSSLFALSLLSSMNLWWRKQWTILSLHLWYCLEIYFSCLQYIDRSVEEIL